jgi:hypothetical protein
LEIPLGLLDPPVAFSWWPCPSGEALSLAAAGLVHVAGVRLRGPGGEYNASPAAELLPQGGDVIGFCSWDEGKHQAVDAVIRIETSRPGSSTPSLAT